MQILYCSRSGIIGFELKNDSSCHGNKANLFHTAMEHGPDIHVYTGVSINGGTPLSLDGL
jgi:hypothetical protein